MSFLSLRAVNTTLGVHLTRKLLNQVDLFQVTLSKEGSSGDYSLEAGALVLGDQGAVLCTLLWQQIYQSAKRACRAIVFQPRDKVAMWALNTIQISFCKICLKIKFPAERQAIILEH